MTIGIPRALLYYRYGSLWSVFFKELGLRVLISDASSKSMLMQGIAHSVGECCLPAKLFMGHVSSLLGRCDYILVPRFKRLQKSEEFCVRFWGLPDIVRNTFLNARIIGYDLHGNLSGNEFWGFLKMGKSLGRPYINIIRAYRRAKKAQEQEVHMLESMQLRALKSTNLKILIAAQPYILHDAYIFAPILSMLEKEGGVPVFSDRLNRGLCHMHARALSKDLYWTLNKEMIGAIPLAGHEVDGVLLISAFPCGTDSLVNELVLRRVRDIPVIQIVLDEQDSEAGLATRIECFMDILRERRSAYGC